MFHTSPHAHLHVCAFGSIYQAPAKCQDPSSTPSVNCPGPVPGVAVLTSRADPGRLLELFCEKDTPFVCRVLTSERSYSTRLVVKRCHSRPGAMAVMPFSLLCFPVPGSFASRRHPWSALRKNVFLFGSQAETQPECEQELGEGKGENQKEGPGGTREAVGGLRPGAAREPAGLARAPPGPPGGPTKASPGTHPVFCGRETQRGGKNTEKANSTRTREPTRNSRSRGPLASASEHSIPEEGAPAACSRWWEPQCLGPAQAVHPGRRAQDPDKCWGRLQDAPGQAWALGSNF